jgi:hypothetical protein
MARLTISVATEAISMVILTLHRAAAQAVDIKINPFYSFIWVIRIRIRIIDLSLQI